MLAKSCVLCYVLTNGDGDDHGAHRADTTRAHARWRYLVALHEATDPRAVFSRRHGCRNRSEGFLLAKQKHTNIPTMMEPFPSPAAWF